MNTAHNKCAGSGVDAEIGTLAASTIISFNRFAAKCCDAGFTAGHDV